MSDEITKSELMAMIEVQSKAAQQMERIANSLNVLAEEQKILTKCFSNGMPAKIVSDIVEKNQPTCDLIKQMAGDMNWMKIIIGSASVVILIATTVLHFWK